MTKIHQAFKAGRRPIPKWAIGLYFIYFLGALTIIFDSMRIDAWLFLVDPSLYLHERQNAPLSFGLDFELFLIFILIVFSSPPAFAWLVYFNRSVFVLGLALIIEVFFLSTMFVSFLNSIARIEDRFDINFEDDVIGHLVRFASFFFNATFLWTVSIAFATVILLIPTIRDTWRRFHSLP